MSKPEQLTLIFRTFDFEGRNKLSVADICTKLGKTRQHVINLIEAGELVALDAAVVPENRSHYIVPIEAYRDFIIRRLTGDTRKQFLEGLPRKTLEEVFQQLKELLAA